MTKLSAATILSLTMSVASLGAEQPEREVLPAPSPLTPYGSSYAPIVPEPAVPAPYIPFHGDAVVAGNPIEGKLVEPSNVIYRSHRLHRRRRLACLPTREIVLRVADPVRCCVTEIPLCLPTCCAEPCLTKAGGRLGRGVVQYSWDCGVRVKIVFRHSGEAVVHYYGI